MGGSWPPSCQRRGTILQAIGRTHLRDATLRPALDGPPWDGPALDGLLVDGAWWKHRKGGAGPAKSTITRSRTSPQELTPTHGALKDRCAPVAPLSGATVSSSRIARTSSGAQNTAPGRAATSCFQCQLCNWVAV